MVSRESAALGTFAAVHPDGNGERGDRVQPHVRPARPRGTGNACRLDKWCTSVPDDEVWMYDPRAETGGYWVAGCAFHREGYLAEHPESQDGEQHRSDEERADQDG